VFLPFQVILLIGLLALAEPIPRTFLERSRMDSIVQGIQKEGVAVMQETLANYNDFNFKLRFSQTFVICKVYLPDTPPGFCIPWHDERLISDGGAPPRPLSSALE